MYLKNVYEVDQQLGGGVWSLSACWGGGWGIDLQERLKIANPGGMPGGYCYQSN